MLPGSVQADANTPAAQVTRECMSVEPAPGPKTGVCTGPRTPGDIERSPNAPAICKASTSALFYADTKPDATRLYWHVCVGAATERIGCVCSGHLTP